VYPDGLCSNCMISAHMIRDVECISEVEESRGGLLLELLYLSL